jgi:rod shape-determining protein MreD
MILLNKIHIKYLLVFILALSLQLTIIKYLYIFNWRPDLILIVLVSFSIRFGPNWGMTAGFFLGIIQDLLSTHFLGLAALSKTIAGFISGILVSRISQRVVFFLTLLIASLFHDLCYFFFYALGEDLTLQSLLFLFTIPNTLYTVLFGALFHYAIEPWLNE